MLNGLPLVALMNGLMRKFQRVRIEPPKKNWWRMSWLARPYSVERSNGFAGVV